jgi:hypothetical protein
MLRAWLHERSLLDSEARAQRADVLRAAASPRGATSAAFREQRRAQPSRGRGRARSRRGVRAGVALHFRDEGPALLPSRGGVDGAVGRMLAIVGAMAVGAVPAESMPIR